MENTHRPRRSVLYIPGSNARALEKAKGLQADVLILDLEDAVTPAEKNAARDQLVKVLQAGGYGARELVVRINGLETDWGEADLAAMCMAGPDALLIPKVNSGELIEEIDILMEKHGAPESTQIWAMMETPLGVLHAESIATASSRLTAFVMGTNDLVKDLQAEHTPDRAPIHAALGLCVLAARAYGIACIDGVYSSINDETGFRSACEQGRQFGFDGKTLIHPNQLAIANDVFAPSEAQLDLAREYVSAFEAAEAEGKGVAVVKGSIVENLHVENARRLLALDSAIKALEGGS